MGPGDNYRRTCQIQVVKPLPVLAAYEENILKAVGGDEDGSCPLSFKKGIGADSRAMDDFEGICGNIEMRKAIYDGPGGIIRC